MITQRKPQLGYLESIGQVLALRTENIATEHQTIWQLFKQADERTFYQLVPHLFMTTSTKEPLVVEGIKATPEGYQHFKELLKEDK